MADNNISITPILDKKMDEYGFEKNNFIADGEITVTITINEYRNLVKEVATKAADIDKANKDKWARDNENKKLKEEVAALKAELLDISRKETNTNESEDEQNE